MLNLIVLVVLAAFQMAILGLIKHAIAWAKRRPAIGGPLIGANFISLFCGMASPGGSVMAKTFIVLSCVATLALLAGPWLDRDQAATQR